MNGDCIQQTTQGHCTGEVRSEVIAAESDGGEELLGSQADLLSSPRHSELSLISESSSEMRSSQYGLAVRRSKEVRDPNFSSSQKLETTYFDNANYSAQKEAAGNPSSN